MSVISEQVRRARSRLWMATFINVGCRVFCAGVTLFALTALVTRLAGWELPVLIVGGVLLGLVLVVSLVWTSKVAPDLSQAAAALDKAAGLRERVSSSLYCEKMDDPFAAAVMADAERRAGSLTVRQHLRLQWPDTMGWAVAAVLVAAGVFLVPLGLLRSDETRATVVEQAQLQQTRVEIKKQIDDVKKMAQTNPALSDLKEELEKLDTEMMGKMERPTDMRHEAIKKIDRVADAVRDKQKDERFDKVTETKRMLRALEQPNGEKTPVQKLTRDLAAGDFKAAKETMQKMKEQLATLKKDSDKQFVEKMQKQLDQLAKQMESLANQENLKKQLEQAGLKKEDVERMLQQLSKEDLQQLQKQLEKKGLSQQQISQLAQQIKKQQGAAQAMKNMSQAMKSAAKAAGDGQMGQAMGEMEAAGDQLSELEQLEQEMNQLESAMKDLNNARSQCQGNGQGEGQKQGQGPGEPEKRGGGMGKLGQGKGGLARSNQTDVGFKVERGEVKTTKGKIVGQFLVDGEQVRGEASDEFVELITAAERVATDTVNRDRLPRQYQKSVKDYFSRLPSGFGITIQPSAGTESEGAGESGGDASAEAPTSNEE